ncbi:MAG TPA: alkaline phosphatase D family protein [Flavitalea sp.]|nr:alkaline phosphatase D family protein [Flavitalea sp.]
MGTPLLLPTSLTFARNVFNWKKSTSNFILSACILLISFFANAQNEVVYLWSGAITSSSARVNAKMTLPTDQARLVVSTSPDLSSPIYGPYATADASNNLMAPLSISGLTANTTYYYGVEADDVLDNSSDDIGRFRTAGPRMFSFRIVTGSCAMNSNHPVYDRMAEKDPFIFIVSGDFHYANPNSATNINVHRTPYETNMLSQAPSRNFLLKYPFAYTWDDHDFSGNNSDSTAAGRANARRAYREYVPHYPLAAGSGDEPIYHSFTVGRIHFIMTDLRSVRGLGNDLSVDPSLSMMGTLQKQWFKDQCIYARDRNLIIAWVSSVTFGGDRPDNWGGFIAEREELSNFFKASAIKNMFIISGDSHMLALDNGTNHDFSTLKDNPKKYPVFPAAALNQNGSNKGGTYSEGKFTNPDATYGQYGMIDVTDGGANQVTITFNGFRVTDAGVESTLISNKSFIMTTGFVLPVTITSFSVQPANNGNKLTWNVEEPDDCDHFAIEKSSNGIHFTNLADISCKNMSGPQMYNYLDDHPISGNNYYRIKVVNENGKEFYSAIRKVVAKDKEGIRYVGSPVKNQLYVKFDNPLKKKMHFSIVNLLGQRVITGDIESGAQDLKLSTMQLSSGLYLLQIKGVNFQQTLKFVVQ